MTERENGIGLARKSISEVILSKGIVDPVNNMEVNMLLSMTLVWMLSVAIQGTNTRDVSNIFCCLYTHINSHASCRCICNNSVCPELDGCESIVLNRVNFCETRNSNCRPKPRPTHCAGKHPTISPTDTHDFTTSHSITSTDKQYTTRDVQTTKGEQPTISPTDIHDFITSHSITSTDKQYTTRDVQTTTVHQRRSSTIASSRPTPNIDSQIGQPYRPVVSACITIIVLLIALAIFRVLCRRRRSRERITVNRPIGLYKDNKTSEVNLRSLSLETVIGIENSRSMEDYRSMATDNSTEHQQQPPQMQQNNTSLSDSQDRYTPYRPPDTQNEYMRLRRQEPPDIECSTEYSYPYADRVTPVQELQAMTASSRDAEEVRDHAPEAASLPSRDVEEVRYHDTPDGSAQVMIESLEDDHEYSYPDDPLLTPGHGVHRRVPERSLLQPEDYFAGDDDYNVLEVNVDGRKVTSKSPDLGHDDNNINKADDPDPFYFTLKNADVNFANENECWEEEGHRLDSRLEPENAIHNDANTVDRENRSIGKLDMVTPTKTSYKRTNRYAM